ncbi:MAG: hypothetical protein ACRCZO_05900 [Cetobacterium sp.]
MGTIYIACLENFATGGTELLHQLYYKLKKNKKDVKIFYYNYTNGNPISERFQKYEVEYVTKIEDEKSNLLIVPEICTEILNNYKTIQKSIWWLSVDNYFVSRLGSPILWKRILKNILGIKKKQFDFKDKDVLHFVQSEYAKKFLEEKGITDIKYLSDYLNDIFLKEEVDYTSKNREDLVLYNPKKGIEFTQKIMNKFKELKFIALENLTPNEVKELCKKSKVYIDFGNHPGKDRFPREAAILGCCIITGKRGSAKYYEDVKIESEYKFEDLESNIEKIGNKITEIFNNYDTRIQNFEIYRNMIKEEETNFEKDIQRIFKDK